MRIARRRIAARAEQRAVAQIDGQPVLIHNTARHYYDSIELAAGATRSGSGIGEVGDVTGFRVWESAPLAIAHLERRRASIVCGRSVIELGAGTGAVGLSAAALGAKHVVLSDADSVVTLAAGPGEREERSRLESLAENARLNGERAAAVSVAPCRWGDAAHLADLAGRWPEGFDTVVASDVLYSPRSYAALGATIRALAGADATVVLAFPERHGGEARRGATARAVGPLERAPLKVTCPDASGTLRGGARAGLCVGGQRGSRRGRGGGGGRRPTAGRRAAARKAEMVRRWRWVMSAREA